MAKGKRSKGRNYQSKGERPSVNKKVRNDVRRNRPWTVESMLQSERMMSKEKKDIIKKAQELYSKYGDRATWAACVQAVKTDRVSEFTNKYYERGTAQKNKKKVKA